MNWIDILVIAVIAVFAIIGIKNGFVYSIFRLLSLFLSVVISLKFYPVVANLLLKTKLYTVIKQSFFKSLTLQQPPLATGASGQANANTARTIIHHLKVPEFFKETISNRVPDSAGLLGTSKIMDALSSELAIIIISVISLILLFVLVRFGLVFLRVFLQGIAKLPIFKQVNKLGGFALGAVEGLLSIYVLFTVLMLFNSAPQFKQVYDAIESSTIASFFYQNNFIISLMFPS
jgi:uncharacterized membrane protein required for colicin V production